ncbi:MAG: HAMP domain-containing histidine kinase [Anaerolineales bacterium]|nr:HAMP domain-containing histidine kinase [Anaerolineales bacterium]
MGLDRAAALGRSAQQIFPAELIEILAHTWRTGAAARPALIAGPRRAAWAAHSVVRLPSGEVVLELCAAGAGLAAAPLAETPARPEFLAAAVRELRVLLSGVVGSLDLVLGNTWDMSAAPRSFLWRARAGAERLGEIVDELVTLAALQAGRLTVAREALPLGWVPQALGREMLPLVEAHGLELDLRLPPEPWPLVLADPAHLRTLLRLLLGEALQQPADTPIVVTVAATAADLATVTLEWAGSGSAAPTLGLLLASRLADLTGGGLTWEAACAGRPAQAALKLPLVPA